MVYDGEEPNRDVTGTLGEAEVMIHTDTCDLITGHNVSHKRRRNEIKSCVDWSVDVERRSSITVHLDGPLLSEDTIITTARKLNDCVLFAAQGRGPHSLTITEITDKLGSLLCAGRFEEQTIIVP